MTIVPRALRSRILCASAPVVVLEGARDVGKTVLVRDLLDPDSPPDYATFEDPSTLEEAGADPVAWLRRRRDYAVIDEAQLLPGLQLAVKTLVDEPGIRRRIILTGSASLPNDELGGDAPLTRRSQRFELRPLTQWELAGGPGSVVDALFDAPLSGRGEDAYTHEELLTRATIGGFPRYAAPGTIVRTDEVLRRVGGDIDATLTHRLVPRLRVDSATAKSILDAVLSTPGGIFAAEPYAGRLGLDRRTVNRYMQVLRRLFFIYWLPNLAQRAKPQSVPSRAKVYPIDTSFSISALHGRGVDIENRSELFGGIVESIVANELTAAAAWSQTQPAVRYWRDAKTQAEVDLVLTDDRHRSVGVEVKATTAVGPDDARGLRALDRSKDGPLYRGFIVHTGSNSRQVDDRIWAVPLRSVLEPGTFGEYLQEKEDEAANDRPVTARSVTTMAAVPSPLNETASLPGDATLFLSYVHSDDSFLGGGIVRFARDLVEAYAALTGRAIELFVDRDNIEWGEAWRTRLDRELDQTAFLLCAVTPRYLNSSACREELARFRASSSGDESRTVLPLLVIDVDSADAASDPTMQVLGTSQFVNPERPLDEFVDADEPVAYRKFVKQTARRLEAVVRRREREASDAVRTMPTEADRSRDDDDVDLVASMEEFERIVPLLRQRAEEFGAAFDEVGRRFDQLSMPSDPSARAMNVRMTRLGKELDEPLSQLTSAAAGLSEVWRQVDAVMNNIVGVVRTSAFPDRERRDLVKTLDGAVRGFTFPQGEEIRSQVELFGRLSRSLRPAARALGNALGVVNAIHASAQSWRDELAD